MISNPLFEPAILGDITLSNRIVMAPLTRNRAGAAASAKPISPIRIS